MRKWSKLEPKCDFKETKYKLLKWYKRWLSVEFGYFSQAWEGRTCFLINCFHKLAGPRKQPRRYHRTELEEREWRGIKKRRDYLRLRKLLFQGELLMWPPVAGFEISQNGKVLCYYLNTATISHLRPHLHPGSVPALFSSDLRSAFVPAIGPFYATMHRIRSRLDVAVEEKAPAFPAFLIDDVFRAANPPPDT